MGLAVLGGPGGVLGWVMNESFGCVERRPRWRKTALRVQAPRASWPNRYLPREKARLSTDLSIRARNASWPGRSPD
jgi:hypothetical protein